MRCSSPSSRNPGEKPSIKLAHAIRNPPERQLRRWRLAAELSHPNLMRLFERGTWQLDNVPLLYVVMEYADEDLSQVIPERPLTVQEAREMLEPALRRWHICMPTASCTAI